MSSKRFKLSRKALKINNFKQNSYQGHLFKQKRTQGQSFQLLTPSKTLILDANALKVTQIKQ